MTIQLHYSKAHYNEGPGPLINTNWWHYGFRQFTHRLKLICSTSISQSNQLAESYVTRQPMKRLPLGFHADSIRLSVTRRYCVETKRASVMISSPSGSPTILVFWRQISSRHSKGFPRAGASNKGRVGKLAVTRPWPCPFWRKILGVMSVLSLKTCIPKLKSVDITVLELLAFYPRS